MARWLRTSDDWLGGQIGFGQHDCIYWDQELLFSKIPSITTLRMKESVLEYM